MKVSVESLDIQNQNISDEVRIWIRERMEDLLGLSESEGAAAALIG